MLKATIQQENKETVNITLASHPTNYKELISQLQALKEKTNDHLSSLLPKKSNE